MMPGRATLVALLGLIAVAPAHAQDAAADYPSRPIRIIAAVPAGGGIDSITRIVADKLRQRFGQPVTVENRGGQSGNIGTEAVFTAEPDGYTLLSTVPAPLTVNAALYKKLLFDPSAFQPVAVMTTIPLCLAVRPDFPAASIRDFIAYAKANPGKLNYASQGNGTSSHLTAELFQRLTGTKLVHVPYKGTGPAINDLIASHVDLMFLEMAAATELLHAGRVKILAMATAARVPALPDVPTLQEAGLKDFESDTWNAIMAPPKTPPAIATKLNAAINAALSEPEVRARLNALSATPGNMDLPRMGQFIRDETARWTEVVRSAGIKIE